MGITARVAERISTQLKKYQSILADAHARDVSESGPSMRYEGRTSTSQ